MNGGTNTSAKLPDNESQTVWFIQNKPECCCCCFFHSFKCTMCCIRSLSCTRSLLWVGPSHYFTIGWRRATYIIKKPALSPEKKKKESYGVQMQNIGLFFCWYWPGCPRPLQINGVCSGINSHSVHTLDGFARKKCLVYRTSFSVGGRGGLMLHSTTFVKEG